MNKIQQIVKKPWIYLGILYGVIFIILIAWIVPIEEKRKLLDIASYILVINILVSLMFFGLYAINQKEGYFRNKTVCIYVILWLFAWIALGATSIFFKMPLVAGW